MLCRGTVNRRAGRAVGRRLRALGHRRIAFVNADQGIDWPEQRLAGIREAMHGVGDIVHVPVPSPGRIDEVGSGVRRVLDAALRAAEELPPMLAEGLRARTVSNAINRAVHDSARRTYMARALEPIIDDRTITVWVTSNDRAAIVCHDLLRRRGVRVPQQLSLVSYDDTLEASFLNLASYTFNSAGMADALLGFLLNPHSLRTHHPEPQVVDIPGRVVMRHSLARPRRGGALPAASSNATTPRT
jgi:DNA-binding LacI/PurR family transcriptional regulator